MSRLDGYLNKDTMEREDASALIEDDSQDIKIFRYSNLDESDGFRKQNPVRDLRLWKIIKGRIDRSASAIQPRDGDVVRSVVYTYVATLYYKGLQIDDVLEMNSRRYTVTSVSKVGNSFTEAEVEVQS